MSDLLINKDFLFEIDSVLEGENLTQYDIEIQKIVDNLWYGIGEFEELIQPFFTSFLKDHLLPSLYINYLALVKLDKQYDNISVEATTSVIDIIGNNLNFNLEQNRTNYDLDWSLSRILSFDHPQLLDKSLKTVLRRLRDRYIIYMSTKKSIEVLYLNAGKLHKDFASIPNSLDANHIFNKKSKQKIPDTENIKHTVIGNIHNLNLSIPSSMIIELLNQKVFKYLDLMFDRIFMLSDFIKANNVKLVIVSASTNEVFLALLAAARISKIESLVIPHGMPTVFNPKLDNYCTYQGTINIIEHKYDGILQFKFKADWFEKVL
jgi:hypothetical protein